MGGFAWVTLATNDSYSLGALVLAHSLKQVGTNHQLAVLVTPGVTAPMREKLASVFNLVQEVNILDSKDEKNLRLLQRPELGVTFTKLHCWRLTQFDKCVFLDADTLVLKNCDELFDRDELSAAPDVGWPDCFNSGVFVYRPNNETYEKLIQFALEKGSFDGGDQGLLNLYFSDWATKDIDKHLPFIYNLCSTACYSYLPAFKQFGTNAKIIHFIGSSKPWLQYFNTETRQVQPSEDLKHLQGILQHWWNIFCSMIHSQLTADMSGLAGAFAQLTLGAPRTAEQSALDDHLRRQGWEVGNIDYMGRDSFDNIWSKICETLSTGAPATDKPAEPAVAPTSAAQTESNTQATSQQPQTTQESALLEQTESPKCETSPVIEKDLESKPEASQECPLSCKPTDKPLQTEGVAKAPEETQAPASISDQPITTVEICPKSPGSEAVTPSAPLTESCPLVPKEDAQKAAPVQEQQSAPAPQTEQATEPDSVAPEPTPKTESSQTAPEVVETATVAPEPTEPQAPAAAPTEAPPTASNEVPTPAVTPTEVPVPVQLASEPSPTALASPVQEAPAPTTPAPAEPAPANEAAAATPALSQKTTTPATAEPAPATEALTPAAPTAAAAQEATAPAIAAPKTAPSLEATAPATPTPAPAKEASTPATPTVAPAQELPTPASAEKAPEPAPAQEASTAPVAAQDAPTLAAPAQEAPSPAAAAPVAAQQAQEVSALSTPPVPTPEASVPTTPAPAPAKEAKEASAPSTPIVESPKAQEADAVAPAVTESCKKPSEQQKGAGKSKAPEAASTASPVPPPRKSGGGGKKTKSKK